MKIIKRIIAVFMICIFATSIAISADTASDKKALEQKNKQLQQTQKEINQKNKEKNSVKKSIAELDDKLHQAEKELDTVEGQLTSLESQIVITKRDLERASQSADGQRDLLKKRVRVMYETGSVGYLSVILDSTSFGDFISRMDFLKKIMEYDVTLLKSMKAHRDNIAQKKAQLQSEMDEKERLKQQIGDKKEQVASAKDDRTKALNEVLKDLKELNRLEDKLLQESKELEKRILASQNKNSKYVGGKIEWPVPSSTRITSPYGYRVHPILKTKKLHTGIDIGASSGKDVIAGNNGKVIFAGYYGGYGYTVIIDHGGKVSTLYAHNSKLLVKEGDEVKRGQVISKIGSTGLSTGPHLHFEVRENGQHRNPMNYLGK